MRGTSYERGKQHGEQAGDLVEKAIRLYFQFPPSTEEATRREAWRIDGTLRRRCPNLVGEMEGIAAGAGLPYEDILLLNVFYDAQVVALKHCTSIALPRTPDGPLLAKTDDVSLAERGLETFFRAELPEGEGYSSIYYAFAGTLWAIGGINRAGLAQVMTGLVPGKTEDLDGIPSCLFLRLLLDQCGTVDEALDLSERQPLLRWGLTLALADPSSEEVVMVEDYPTARGVQRSRSEPLVRTNYAHLPETKDLMAVAQYASVHPGLWENSLYRYANGARLAPKIEPSVDGLKNLLRDHTEPGAICQHGQADLHTALAIILAPRRRTMLVAEGYGCGDYREWTI